MTRLSQAIFLLASLPAWAGAEPTQAPPSLLGNAVGTRVQPATSATPRVQAEPPAQARPVASPQGQPSLRVTTPKPAAPAAPAILTQEGDAQPVTPDLPDLQPSAQTLDAAQPSPTPQPLFLPQPPQPGQPVERVVWNKRPIPVTLTVGRERLISFRTTVKFGPPQHLVAKLRDPQSLQGTLYVTATEPFAPTRVLVQECTPPAPRQSVAANRVGAEGCVPSGLTYILNLQAVREGGATAPMEVFAPAAAPAHSGGSLPDQGQGLPQTRPAYTPVQLVRFGFQQLLAPGRLLSDLPGVVRVPLRTRGPLPLYEGGALAATPEVSWSDGSVTVTALLLRNRTMHPQAIDPRAIRGQWLSRSLLWGRTRLRPAGDPRGEDLAPVILVSPQPFAETVRWLRP